MHATNETEADTRANRVAPVLHAQQRRARSSQERGQSALTAMRATACGSSELVRSEANWTPGRHSDPVPDPVPADSADCDCACCAASNALISSIKPSSMLSA